MYEYKHGGNAIFENENILDLSANINPLGLPEGVEEAIKNDIQNCTRYPDNSSSKLRNEIAYYDNVEKENIFCGNGASDIIFRLPLVTKPRRGLILAPTFSDYERSIRAFGSDIVYYNLKEKENFTVQDEILETIKRKNVDLVFICNPNNPTGMLTKRTVIKNILELCKNMNTLVVVDECFMDFTLQSSEYTVKPLLKEYNNLIILKAFTKVFALPGIRLGYALSSNLSIINNLYNYGADWAVSNLAQSAGIAALKNWQSYIQKTLEFLTYERAYLKNELENLGFAVFDSSANYIFFKSPYAFDLYAELDKKEIRIRSCDNYIGLSKAYYRIGISSQKNNRKLIHNMKEVIKCQNL